MKVQYENEFVKSMEIGDSITCVYQLIYNENDNGVTKTTQYFIIHGLGIWINVGSYVEHMFYACSFRNNTEIPIAIKKNSYFISLTTDTTIFYWGAGNWNKTELKNYMN